MLELNQHILFWMISMKSESSFAQNRDIIWPGNYLKLAWKRDMPDYIRYISQVISNFSNLTMEIALLFNIDKEASNKKR